MKRFIAIVCALVCVILSAFALAACADYGAPEYSVDGSGLVISAESVASKIEEFAAIEDRTTYTKGEKKAATYLMTELLDFGYDTDDVEVLGFSLTDNNYQVDSQNVKAVYRSSVAGENAKNVIIGAYYDNRYGTTAGYSGVGSTGAIANCTGVAATLAIAEYLQAQKPALDYTVTIVFFGAGAVSDYGAQHYYRGMSPADRANTVLMVELQRLGFEHVYAFSDERKSSREPFFDGVAADNKLDIYKPTQKSPIMTGMYALEGIPFYRWAHTGIFAPFFNSGIPTLNLVGADWETLDVTDNDRVTITSADTYANMLKNYPKYAENTATAASFMVKALEADGFLAAMQYDRENFPDTDVLNKDWIWYLVVLCSVLIGVPATYLVTARLAKKYPIVAPQPKTVKMAVFGMDYEDKNSADIFVDVKRVSALDDIFPGIPNNDAPSARGDSLDPFGLDALPASSGRASDPFDMNASDRSDTTQPQIKEQAQEPNTQAPKENDSQEYISQEQERAADAALQIGEADDNSVAQEERAEQPVPADDADKAESPDKPVAPKTPRTSKPSASRTATGGSKSTSGTTKRKTVSAGKSVHGGGKSNADGESGTEGEEK